MSGGTAAPGDGGMLPPPLQHIPRDIVAVSDYQAVARAHLDAPTWAWLSGGAADELTLADNVAASARLKLRNRVLADVAGGDTAVSLHGQRFEHPILLAPVAYQRLVHPEGELATAMAATALQAGMVVSTQSSTAIEDIARVAQAPLWFQLYFQPDRGFTRELALRAQASGCRALVLTVDAPVTAPRNREARAGFALPAGIEAVHLRGGAAPPSYTAVAGQDSGGGLLGSALLAAAPRWPDLAWLCAQTALPVWVKGVIAPEDALQAEACGAAGVIVSNHGGRSLDTLPASLDALPAVVRALEGRLPVLMDGGIRRGTDVLKALALGASAVMVGRAYMQGLAAAGALGVAHVLHLLRAELEAAMALTGCRTVADIDRSVLWTPDARVLQGP